MRGGLTEKVAVRMTPAERMGLERLAKVRGRSLSDVVRDAIGAMLGLSDDDCEPLQRVNTRFTAPREMATVARERETRNG